MCNPAALALTGSLITAGGSVAGGFMSSSIARRNATMFEQQAQLREQKAIYDAAQAEQKFRKTQGQAIANIGTTGIDIQSFSDVLADSAIESALEIKAIKFQGAAEAANLRFQAKAQQQQGRAAIIGGIFQGLGYGLSGIGKYQLAQAGQGTGDLTTQPWSYRVNPNYSG